VLQRRDRIAFGIPPAEKDDIAGVRRTAVDTKQQPAIVFSRGSRTRHEHGFAVLIGFRNDVSLHRRAILTSTLCTPFASRRPIAQPWGLPVGPEGHVFACLGIDFGMRRHSAGESQVTTPCSGFFEASRNRERSTAFGQHP
jgi:hypothetical protein